ncbi:kinase-like domain-containing protein [Lophiotrema nucula]|uniref:EKC/KEOPS complex subunit BUD32 n=1 Tax=Lophiotrema nucula TaxID=690887 RepID=A0A6A5ZXC4_9PLEO|nr:kinase-like domain-containing protein [Lophiotrema nucula]
MSTTNMASTASDAQPPTTPPPTQPLHALPQPFTTSNLEVLTQGAEALVYKTTFLTPSTPCVLKYRPPKLYRHPILDKRLTKARLLAEARVLVKCRREGLSVPAVLGGDWESGWLVLEWIGGRTVRAVLDEWVHKFGLRARDGKTSEEEVKRELDEGLMEVVAEEKESQEAREGLMRLMQMVGRAVGKLHEIGVCHGDLTTSNLMLRTPERKEVVGRGPPRMTVSAQREAAMSGQDPPEVIPVQQEETKETNSLEGDVVMIDFGLATQTIHEEDRAVDLYVLERAFTATHPAAEHLFQEVLRCYGESFKGAKTVLKRLADVRLRGRKRTMIG